MLVAALVGVIVLLGSVVVWLLRPGPRRRAYQVELDLTAAAARGELEFDWPLIHTERNAHPRSWCSPDWCGRQADLDAARDLRERHPHSRSAA